MIKVGFSQIFILIIIVRYMRAKELTCWDVPVGEFCKFVDYIIIVRAAAFRPRVVLYHALTSDNSLLPMENSDC